MPAPTPSVVARRRARERADRDREVGAVAVGVDPARARRSTRRAAPARGLRSPACTRGFGAPVTDAGGNVARSERRRGRRRAAASPRTVLTRWTQPGMARPRTARAPRSSRARTPGRGRCGRGRRSSRSRRGPSRWRSSARRARGRALDRPGLDASAVDAQEALGRRRHHRESCAVAPARGVRRRVAALGRWRRARPGRASGRRVAE